MTHVVDSIGCGESSTIVVDPLPARGDWDESKAILQRRIAGYRAPRLTTMNGRTRRAPIRKAR